MRFKKLDRYEFQDTRRKRLAYARKLRRELERYPLFADELSAKQLPVDDEMMARARRWAEQEIRERKRRAADWRRARQKLRGYPGPVKAALKRKWQQCDWPADPAYLLSMMHMYDNGRLDLPNLDCCAA